MGEFGVDLKKVREVARMFDITRMRKGLTSHEKQLRYDLEAKRASFELDRYVSITEVHGIV